MVAIGDVFSAVYGDKRYETKGPLKNRFGQTPLIASGSRNNGVYGLFDIPATKQHVISVARTGSVGATFYHSYPCEISSDALVLAPKRDISPENMAWFAWAIGLNRFRFNYGRKVTPDRVRAFRVPEPPENLPKIGDVATSMLNSLSAIKFETARFKSAEKRWSTVEELFTVEYGNSYELCSLRFDPVGINFVSRRMGNNGISARVANTGEQPFPAGCLSVALGGNGVLETCVQPSPFYTGRDVAILTPKSAMSLEEKLFYCCAIKVHKFRFGFGRQANRTLPSLRIPPLPDWIRGGMVLRQREQIGSRIRGLFPDKISS